MKKICFLIGSINYSGGTERVTSIIANELASQQYQVSILSLSDGMTPFFELDSRIRVDQLYSKKISMKYHYLCVIWRIRKHMLKHKIDTLIVVDSISCVFTVPALFGCKIKHICWEHFNFNVDLGVSYRRVGRKWAAKYCDAIISLTQRDQALWQQALAPMKAKIYPIANPTPFRNIEHTPSLKHKTILSLGRLTSQKGFDLLIDAWSIVCQHNSDWVLQIIGDGEDAAKLKQQCLSLGLNERIEFIPATKDVESYYRNCSFYCMSSRFEGLPMVLLEAQAFGLPIVSFDCDTGPAELITDGVNGYLVNPLDVEGLAKKILEMMQIHPDRYVAMSLAATAHSKKFYLENIIKNWTDVV